MARNLARCRTRIVATVMFDTYRHAEKTFEVSTLSCLPADAEFEDGIDGWQVCEL